MPKNRQRIPSTPADIRDALKKAEQAAKNEPNWSSNPDNPTPEEINAMWKSIDTGINDVESDKAKLSQDRAALRKKGGEGRAMVVRIDQITDGLYGPTSKKKLEYGVDPQLERGKSVALEQVVIVEISDGKGERSLNVDWFNVPGAVAYEAEFFSDAEMKNLLKSESVSTSEIETGPFELGSQVWVRVRAIRGQDKGPWSDPATRIINL